MNRAQQEEPPTLSSPSVMILELVKILFDSLMFDDNDLTGHCVRYSTNSQTAVDYSYSRVDVYVAFHAFGF